MSTHFPAGAAEALISGLFSYSTRVVRAAARGGVVGPHLVGGSGGPPSCGGEWWAPILWGGPLMGASSHLSRSPAFPPRRETPAPGGSAPMPPATYGAHPGPSDR